MNALTYQSAVPQRGLAVPSVLYFVANVTAIYVLRYLPSFIFTAIMSTRIVFAAMFSILFLKKYITGKQWWAIYIIVCAAFILCLDDFQVWKSVHQKKELSLLQNNDDHLFYDADQQRLHDERNYHWCHYGCWHGTFLIIGGCLS